MSTSVYIKSMTFIKDQASILEEHPVVAFSMEINNEFNIPQEMDKQFSHTMQKTLSAVSLSSDPPDSDLKFPDPGSEIRIQTPGSGH